VLREHFRLRNNKQKSTDEHPDIGRT
jgi:hypothetical protein